ncbi:hypothetical protein [Sphingobacterium humi]|uniref:Uncharacterized protein n=1 Tax=Sphingobacterium humi TaxID=1796905 RepID=A0A6N8L5S0_9SPHI|nr:hypothetical protein [Sphingobacterium humi]MVZ63528.1 hypothetical protein [Sphingobacterium humi]
MNNKMLYVSPCIKLEEIELENGIATNSATLQPGKKTNPFVPEVEDWKDNGFQTNDFDVL